MAILGFGKKKETTPCCGGEQAAPQTCSTCCGCSSSDSASSGDARFLVLGACCQKSADTFANVKTAVAELGWEDTVANIGDNVVIAQYGVMQTPALVVDGKVVCYGKLISVAEAKELLTRYAQK